MNARLNARTTRECLARLTKNGLVQLIAAVGADSSLDDLAGIKRMDKPHLLEEAMRIVDKMARAEKAEADAREAARQTTLAAEREAHTTRTALQNFLVAINKVVTDANETLANFQAEVAGGNIESALTWKTERVLQAVAMLHEFIGAQRWVVGLIENQDQTAEEIAEELTLLADRAKRACLEDGYRHSSTNAVDNINNIARFGATQKTARFYTVAAAAWAKVLVEGHDPIELACLYIMR